VQEEAEVQIGFLNVVATPHPEGVYERLLNTVAGAGVRFFGDHFAAITEPHPLKDDPNVLEGQLVIWTEIDESEPGINKRDLSKVRLADIDFSVPSNIGFNGKVFAYAFNIKRHVFVVEIKNEQGKTISPVRVQKILGRLFLPPYTAIGDEIIEVTVIQEDDAIERVLSMARIDRVDILVKRPNNDDITAETHRIMQNLIEQNAKSEERILVRAPGTPSVILDEDNSKFAYVAASNGHVTATGKNEDGGSEQRSTKQYPKIVCAMIPLGESFAIRVRSAARALGALF
jgi:hypothetical protein